MKSNIDMKKEIRSLGLVFGAIMISTGLLAYLPTGEPWMLILGGLAVTQGALRYI